MKVLNVNKMLFSGYVFRYFYHGTRHGSRDAVIRLL
jgi:hypothetical protein